MRVPLFVNNPNLRRPQCRGVASRAPRHLAAYLAPRPSPQHHWTTGGLPNKLAARAAWDPQTHAPIASTTPAVLGKKLLKWDTYRFKPFQPGCG